MTLTYRLSATAISALMAVTAQSQQLVISGRIGGDIRAVAALTTTSGDTLARQQMDRGRFTLAAAAEAGLYKVAIGQWERAYFLTPGDTIRVSGYVDRQGGESDVRLTGIDAHKRMLAINEQITQAADRYKQWVADTLATMPEERRENAEIELLTKEESAKATAAITAIGNEPDVALAATVALLNAGSAYEDANRVYTALTPGAQATVSGKQLAAKVAGLARTANGATAPDFTVTDAEGHHVQLSSLRGRPVLIDFWASWCGPCRKEMIYLRKLYQELKGRNVAFVSISLDDRREAWDKGQREEQIPWYSWWDEKGFNQSEVRSLYGFNHIPFCVVLDAEGRIVGKDLRRDELRQAILGTITKK